MSFSVHLVFPRASRSQMRIGPRLEPRRAVSPSQRSPPPTFLPSLRHPPLASLACFAFDASRRNLISLAPIVFWLPRSTPSTRDTSVSSQLAHSLISTVFVGQVRFRLLSSCCRFFLHVKEAAVEAAVEAVPAPLHFNNNLIKALGTTRVRVPQSQELHCVTDRASGGV